MDCKTYKACEPTVQGRPRVMTLKRWISLVSLAYHISQRKNDDTKNQSALISCPSVSSRFEGLHRLQNLKGL
jgi:hypothetical protein